MPGTGLEVAGAALAFATSALDAVLKVSDRVAAQLGADGDLAFIRDEFSMMQAFLKAADGAAASRAGKRGKVADAWVRQVRALAYDVEDCLDAAALNLDRRRRLPRGIKARRRIAADITKLRARVEDVSKRNQRYHLVDGGVPSLQQPPAGGGAIGHDHLLHPWSSDVQQPEAQPPVEASLARLVSGGGNGLRVISVWARSDDGMASISVVREVYDDVATTHETFTWRAWVKAAAPARPFDPHRLVEALVRQFYANSFHQEPPGAPPPAVVVGIEALIKMEKMTASDGGRSSVLEVFQRLMKENRYLFVIDDLADAEEWLWIKTYLADYKNGSRVIVRTQHKGIARLCLPQHHQVVIQASDSEFNVSLDGRQPPPVYLMFTKEQETAGGSSDTITGTSKQGDDHSSSSAGATSTTTAKQVVERRDSMSVALEENRLVGREEDASKLIKLVMRNDDGDEFVAVHGASRVGKTALVRSICQSKMLRGTFERLAWFTVRYPFNGGEFADAIRKELSSSAATAAARPTDAFQSKVMTNRRAAAGAATTTAATAGKGRDLIVVDDVSSRDELDRITSALQGIKSSNSRRRVVIITRERSVASASIFQKKDKYELRPLQTPDALKLFYKKVKDPQDKKLAEVAKDIVNKCGGLPQIISTVAGYLQDLPHNQWSHFCDNMSSELVNQSELKDIDRILNTAYKNLPSNLKSCFLYLSVFPEENRIRKRRLVRRWIAEGFSSSKHSTSADQVAEKQFGDLISRNMIQPSGTTIDRIGNNQENCQFGFQNLMHGVSRKRSAKENLVLVLDKNEHTISLQAKSRARHLTVMEDWSRERKKNNALESIVHLSKIRSMTVFGECKSFFISKKMKLLRVLDLEGTHGIRDSDISPIGKLRHLKYLSLRGTDGIFHLPASLGNLYNLETLDVRDTMVTKLPPTIVQLQKLKYLRAGMIPCGEHDSYAIVPEALRDYSFYQETDLKMLVPLICLMVTVWLKGFDVHGVKAPRGIGNLKALHTLGIVNVARGKNVLKEIEKLTQLRKLGITGVKKNHCEELESAISSCSHLQTLSIRAEGKDGLVGCLDLISPPEDLQSLKLYGILDTLPGWIGELQSLVKLTLRSTLLKQQAIKVLGKLPNLTSLRLSDESFEGEELLFPCGSFPNLVALEIGVLIKTKGVKFQEPTMEKPTMARLELLKVFSWWDEEGCLFTGIQHLKSLKEVLLDGLDCGKTEEDFQKSGLKVERMAGQEVTTVGLELTEH